MLGTTLAGKYRIERVLGEGGMGVVYEAFHLRLQHRVAIKMLLPVVLENPEFVARFEREARAAATLESPHVAKILDVDTSPDGLPYMVIEYLEGHDLSEELVKRGRLPVDEAVARVMEACVPIAQAHALGIVHRDLKPANLFLATNGGQQVLKLLDFGVSKVPADAASRMTAALLGLGTPHYMSPEQVRDASDVDQRSDIWSLGIILYELLTGRPPFDGSVSSVLASIVADPVPLPRTFRPDIPEALESVVMHALEKDVDRRFPDIRSLATALAPFAPEEELVPASSVPPPPSDPTPAPALELAVDEREPGSWAEPVPGAPARRSRWAWVLVPAAAAAALGLALVVSRLATYGAVAPRSSATLASSAPSVVDVPVVDVPPPPPSDATVAVAASSSPAPLSSGEPIPSFPIKTRPPVSRPPVSRPPPPATNPLTL
ncbi:MAG TPA: serine/threonine-protein kinase [Polyangiaceae bacterium]